MKNCSRCLERFAISGFYTKGNRTDSCCKTCKKALVFARRVQKNGEAKAKKSLSVDVKRENTPKRIIEPKNDETIQLISSIDFGDIERFSGKQMTRVEKHDAIWRLNEFIGLMLHGYSELKGEDVYVKN